MKSKLSYENILRCFWFPSSSSFVLFAHSPQPQPKSILIFIILRHPYWFIKTCRAFLSHLFMDHRFKIDEFSRRKNSNRKKKKKPQPTFFFLHEPTEITSAKLNVSVTSELFCRNFVLCRLNMIMAVSSTRDNQNRSKLCDQG